MCKTCVVFRNMKVREMTKRNGMDKVKQLFQMVILTKDSMILEKDTGMELTGAVNNKLYLIESDNQNNISQKL